MKVTIQSDRIHWQAETKAEQEAIASLIDVVFFNRSIPEDIRNDHGMNGKWNYCTTPLAMTPDESAAACVSGNANN